MEYYVPLAMAIFGERITIKNVASALEDVHGCTNLLIVQTMVTIYVGYCEFMRKSNPGTEAVFFFQYMVSVPPIGIV